MLSKMSLVASTLGLAVVGTGVDPSIPTHITQTEISAAYTFVSEDACRSKLHAIYAEFPNTVGKLVCKSNNDS